MRIVIDGRLWGESGLGRYIRNLVTELQKIDGVNEYYILHLKKDYDSLVYHTNNFHKVLADFKWYSFGEQIKLVKVLRELKPDLVHFPHFNVPIFYKGKFIVTIHDLIHQHFATREASTLNPFLFAVKKFGYKKVFFSAVKNSSKIIVPSEFIKGQLVKEWKVSEDKVVVTYEGVDEEVMREVGDVREKDFEEVAGKFGISKPYLFYVGNAQPHKNILGLVRVFGEVREKFPEVNLVLAGPESFFWDKIKEELGGLEKLGRLGVVFTGFVSEKEMVVLYKNAEAFVMPSFEEGFGIPLLEAMACSCPVISSNAGSLKEVGGKAAIYFNPKDEKEMVRVVREVVGSKGVREQMIKRGLEQVKKFSWKKLAKETLVVYQKA